MKKFTKFILGAASFAAAAGGALYVLKNYVLKDSDDDYDDFDDFEDELSEEDANENREYVSIEINSDESDNEAQTTENTDISSEDDTADSNDANMDSTPNFDPLSVEKVNTTRVIPS